MDNTKQQLVEKIQAANNILVSVSRDPSVDQLAALLGLTLFLNKQGKHAAAVFSGQVPSTLEFLQPEETFKKNTDSLRDFIIALDKNKADKLRYKVEDDLVRIFITPYKTSISPDDFEFSQGDFNVDLVVAVGVQRQEDLDEAITAHGRILHDATVASITINGENSLGSINWQSQNASSLSELVTELAQALGAQLFDEQIATALLTGIVAETDRFSNDKTTSQTMSLSAALMAAGANQQLVASKLAEPPVERTEDQATGDNTSDDAPEGSADASDPGMIEISHTGADEPTDQPEQQDTSNETEPEPELELPEPAAEPESTPEPTREDQPQLTSLSGGSRLITEAPSLGGTLTANALPPEEEAPTNPLSEPSDTDTPPQILGHNDDIAPANDQPTEPTPVIDPQPTIPVVPPNDPQPDALTPPPADWTPPQPQPDPFNLVPDGDNQPTSDPSLASLESAVKPPEPVIVEPVADADAARDEINRALSGVDVAETPQQPIQALNAQPFGGDLHPAQPAATVVQPTIAVPQEQPTLVAPEPIVQAPQVVDPNAPPPVPPPIPFQFGGAPPQQ